MTAATDKLVKHKVVTPTVQSPSKTTIDTVAIGTTITLNTKHASPPEDPIAFAKTPQSFMWNNSNHARMYRQYMMGNNDHVIWK